ncbi:polyhydroxyalkanoate synthesis regulator DNA-binding domain-containing protein [candidate division WOR-3 bacterium]|nr:polyhydroxyalkanoate synthesis regulator DNA-binding domain-containing protein [candidate division WOR-3 bacterium]
MKLIKRYKNRILYDTVTKSSITLADIARFIRDKVDFRVVESETGEDITGTTIMQVLLNIEKRAKELGNVVKSIRHSAGKKTEKLLHTLMEHIGSILNLIEKHEGSEEG